MSYAGGSRASQHEVHWTLHMAASITYLWTPYRYKVGSKGARSSESTRVLSQGRVFTDFAVHFSNCSKKICMETLMTALQKSKLQTIGNQPQES